MARIHRRNIVNLRKSDAGRDALHRALDGFSGIRSAQVAVLVATGLANSWFVVGLAGLPRLLASAYGQLLTLKVALFVVMVGLAAANRVHLTPAWVRPLTEINRRRARLQHCA